MKVLSKELWARLKKQKWPDVMPKDQQLWEIITTQELKGERMSNSVSTP
jgi:hypothetical protein